MRVYYLPLPADAMFCKWKNFGAHQASWRIQCVDLKIQFKHQFQEHFFLSNELKTLKKVP